MLSVREPKGQSVAKKPKNSQAKGSWPDGPLEKFAKDAGTEGIILSGTRTEGCTEFSAVRLSVFFIGKRSEKVKEGF